MSDFTDEDLTPMWERALSDLGFGPRIEDAANHYPDEKSVTVDWFALDEYDQGLGEHTLTHPEQSLRCGRRALSDLTPPDARVPLSLRVTGLPDTSVIPVRSIRTPNLSSLISVEGIVRRVTEVHPRLMVGLYQCSRCGAFMRQAANTGAIIEPLECSKDEARYVGEPGCGRSGRDTSFVLDREKSEFMDTQKVEIQEAPEGLRGGAQPERLIAYLEDDLAGQLQAGDRARITGVLQCRKKSKGKDYNTVYEWFMDCNSIERGGGGWEDIEVTEDDIRRIRALARDPYEILERSIAPSIHGHEAIKRAIMYFLFGASEKFLPDEVRLRGDIHIFLIGDPSVAKSQFLRYVANTAPRGVFVSGKGTSGPGLTATVTKDEFGEGRWTLEAGAMVMADRGVICIDELDKIPKDARGSIHEAMEQQIIPVAKAGIRAELLSRCGVLAAANPKHGRFDECMPIPEQISIEPALLSRFDLILTILDVANEKKDRDIGGHILRAHRAGSRRARGVDTDMPEIIAPVNPDLLRKWIIFAKREVHPELSDAAMKLILDFYVDTRARAKAEHGTTSMTPRQLEGMYRIAEASARIGWRDVAGVEDAQRSIDAMKGAMGTWTDGQGKIDIDRIETGVSSSQRTRISTIERLIREGAEEEKRGADVEAIYEECEREGMPRERVVEIFQKLHREGTILYPRHNIVAIAPR